MKPLYTPGDYERECAEPGQESPWRPPFSRDYGRIIHSSSFRRLQGKTQVFLGHESDFFRNRLTHSLEVAQIAEGIADRLNHIVPFCADNKISSKLCATASLIHDIGHCPFGHNGERALDDAMKKHGGFEGNAQSLRIVSRVEKKVKDGSAKLFGLNLTYRTLAAILKYDAPVPRSRQRSTKLNKGYYLTEQSLVEKIKRSTLGSRHSVPEGDFQTIECSIMDIADDIAYSTYDLEDSLKAGFLTPADMLATPMPLLERVAKKVSLELKRDFNAVEVLTVIVDLFGDISLPDKADVDDLVAFVERYQASKEIACNGYLRTKLSSQLVSEGINAVEMKVNEQYPPLSTASLSPATHAKIEVPKQYTYHATIFSSRVKLPEFQGYEVVSGIFDALADDRGYLLMPDDVRLLHDQCVGDLDKEMRVICDFIAGMTDRYAMEFYSRLHSDSAQSMFKPT